MDIEKIRRDFPLLEKGIDGKPVIYMDSACMALKPVQVIEAMNSYYNDFPGCAGRSIHKLSNMVEQARNSARKKVKDFVGAKKQEEIIFTRNTTEGLNLVFNSLSLQKGDVVMTTDREHNSNLVPAQMIEKTRGIEHRVVLSNNEYEFNMETLKDMLGPEVKLVSFVYSSNLDGYTLPVKEIIKACHDNNTLVMLDAAQAVPHHELEVKKLGVDFLAFSGHKMCGPTGTGALYVKEEHYDKLSPFITGGETVEWSTYEGHGFLKPPERFEAGLQNYSGEIGLGAACDYLKNVGIKNIEKHESALTVQLDNGLKNIDGTEIVGVKDPSKRAGITSFNIHGMPYHDIAMILDNNHNIMLRSGQHCVHSWFKCHDIEGSVRASLYLYNTSEEIEAFIEAIQKIVKLR